MGDDAEGNFTVLLWSSFFFCIMGVVSHFLSLGCIDYCDGDRGFPGGYTVIKIPLFWSTQEEE